jgi:hypothetical protein
MTTVMTRPGRQKPIYATDRRISVKYKKRNFGPGIRSTECITLVYC